MIFIVLIIKLKKCGGWGWVGGRIVWKECGGVGFPSISMVFPQFPEFPANWEMRGGGQWWALGASWGQMETNGSSGGDLGAYGGNWGQM